MRIEAFRMTAESVLEKYSVQAFFRYWLTKLAVEEIINRQYFDTRLAKNIAENDLNCCVGMIDFYLCFSV